MTGNTTVIGQAIRDFLLTCKVEGRSFATIDCYTTRLESFQWYARHFHWTDDIGAVTTTLIREFLAYLRDNDHRFDSDFVRAKRPVNSTTIRNYYLVLSSMFGWLEREEILAYNPMAKIRAPRAEKKVIHALTAMEVNRLIASFGSTFEGIRNKAIILVMVDCGLRLGELLNLKLTDMDMEAQTLKVDGKTGERFVRYGSTTAQALSRYLEARGELHCKTAWLWSIRSGTGLTANGLETAFHQIVRTTGIAVHPHLLRHTFATLFLRAGGDSLMVQRLLGHTTLTMTARYVQAVGCADAMKSHERFGPADNLLNTGAGS